MGVLDGQPVSQSITNPAFINKNVDDVMSNKLGFNRPFSGPSIADIQQAINNIYTASGVSETSTGTAYNTTPNTITNGDTYQLALSKLAKKFAGATGHTHDGTDGNGPLIASVTSFAASGDLVASTGGITIGAASGAQFTNLGGGNFLISATGHVDSLAASGNSGLHGNVVLATGSGIQMTQSGQVITIAASGALGGGGGGGSLIWIEGVNAPIPIQEYGNEVYDFDAGLTQQLSTCLKTPSSFLGGNQITLKSLFYSAAASGTLLMQTVSTLVRTGVDAISSTTNQRTSTNSALTLSAGTNNIPQAVSFDLTDSTGKINGVSVSAGDLILVTLKRGTDTSTPTAKALVFASESKFS